MPRYNLPIEEIDESVRRPMATAIAYDLLKLFGLDSNIPLVFKGDSAQPLYQNSEINGEYNDGNNRFAGTSLLTIDEVTDELNPTALLSTAIDYPDNKAIFTDTDLRVFLIPIRISKKFDIQMTLTGTEKQIERWGALIKKKTAQGVLNGLHAINYHYPIPRHYLGLLAEIYNRKNAIASNGEEFGHWLKRCFIPTMTVLRDANGNNPIFAIRETQLDIQGWFDFGTGVPKREKVEDGGLYQLRFTYTYYADIPETINMLTPLVIHNQLIPSAWFPQPAPMAELDFIKRYGSYSQEAFDQFRFSTTGMNYTWSATIPGVSIPTFDDWLDDCQPDGYTSVLRLLCKLDETNLKRIQALSKLGEWKIHPLCQNYMKDTRALVTSPYDNVMNLQAYRYEKLMDQQATFLDENLEVTTAKDNNLKEMYHCVVGMCFAPDKLTNRAKEDLRRHGCFFKYWINTLYPGAAEYFGWDLDNCTIGSDDDNMSFDDVGNIIDIVTETDPGKPFWSLVGFFTIVANERDQNE